MSTLDESLVPETNSEEVDSLTLFWQPAMAKPAHYSSTELLECSSELTSRLNELAVKMITDRAAAEIASFPHGQNWVQDRPS